MHSGDNDLSPPYISVYQHGPYSSSIASSASSSSASVWSDAASQSSDDSSAHSGGSDSELPVTYTSYKNASINASTQAANWAQANTANAAADRSHPRRTSGASRAVPPSLVRQCDRKVTFVDGLVDSSAQIVEAIWPRSSVVCRTEMGSKGVLPLRTFIQETLRRSRTSYSTLQVALYYLILIKSHVPQHDFTMEQPVDDRCNRALQCGRRMFLAALILASKYLQDRNYSARAWSKICGLSTVAINQNETAFLLAVNWKLHITEPVFQKWSDIMLRFTSNKPGGPGAIRSCSDAATWKAIVVQLTPELDNMDNILASPSVQARPCKPTSCFAMLGKSPMGLAMSQTSSVSQATERWPTRFSPPGCPLARQSSLATSVSSMSSPESIVSDSSSKSSRSSSISSASSSGSAPLSTTMDIQGRCRYAKQFSERSLKATIAIVHENYSEDVHTLSYESYDGTVGKDLLDMSISTPSQIPTWTADYSSHTEANFAAHALQELHNNPRSNGCSPVNRAGSKRCRPVSIDHSLQENVRDILTGSYECGWSNNLVTRAIDGRKRVCVF